MPTLCGFGTMLRVPRPLALTRSAFSAASRAPLCVGLIKRMAVVAVGLSRMVVRAVTPLRGHITQVVARRAEKEMVRSDALRVVAAVADEQPIGDRVVVQLPRKAVGKQRARRMSAGIQLAVAVAVQRSSPLPAPVRLADLRPEAIRDGRPWGARLRRFLASSAGAGIVRDSRRFRLSVPAHTCPDARLAFSHSAHPAAAVRKIEGFRGQIGGALSTAFQHALNITISGAAA